jgi:hypothetical protein
LQVESVHWGTELVVDSAVVPAPVYAAVPETLAWFPTPFGQFARVMVRLVPLVPTVDVAQVVVFETVPPTSLPIVGVSPELAHPVSPIRIVPPVNVHTVIAPPEYETFWLYVIVIVLPEEILPEPV